MSDPVDRLTAALADRYRIERELGAGGMATVYLAEDLKHDRRVAVKVLRPELAAVLGAERFLHEIRVTANLQHPNILPLYDSGEAASFLYYVMPYVEGESLRDKLHRDKQLSIEETLALTKQVAAALDFAHERGIVHRDIKPENILLQSGQALVADFGIALAVSQAGGARLTETGLSLGTPHYMSPEQATADRDLTARSDVYSLGAMVYEMFVGEPPFTGATGQAVIAKIITDRPRPLRELRDTVPPSTDAAVLTALAKLPADRFASAGAFADALFDPSYPVLLTSVGGTGTIPALARWTIRQPWLGWALPAFTVLLLVAALAVGVFSSRPAASGRNLAMRFYEPPPAANIALAEPAGVNLAISRDGSHVAYAATSEDGLHLYVRDVSETQPQRLPGTAGASQPFFSPDGTSLGFFANNQLYRVSLTGGAPVPIANATNMIGASWSDDGRIVFGGVAGTGLRIVPASGGTPEELISLELEEEAHLFPQVLPGGKHVLFTVRTDQPRLDVADIDGTNRRPVHTGAVAARYVSSGHILYPEAGGLMAQPFDLEHLVPSGTPSLVIDSVFTKSTIGTNVAVFALSGTGTLLYQPGQLRQMLAWQDEAGALTTWTDARWGYWYPNVSPRDGRVAVGIAVSADDVDIWLLGDGPPERFTRTGNNIMPVWTPDGSHIAFTSDRAHGNLDLFWKPVDATGEAEVLLERPGGQYPASWTPDGRTLLFYTPSPETGGDIWTLDLDGDGSPTPIVATAASEIQPALSPDGRWLAYASDVSGTFEVYVGAYPSGQFRRVSESGGLLPIWAADSRRLFYNKGGRRILVTEVTTSTGSGLPEIGPRREVAAGPQFASGGLGNAQYALARDGSRFLVVMAERPPQPPVVVLNWLNTLAR